MPVFPEVLYYVAISPDYKFGGRKGNRIKISSEAFLIGTVLLGGPMGEVGSCG